MDDDTTTGAPVAEPTGGEQPQPAEATPVEPAAADASTEPSEASPDGQGDQSPAAPQVDEELQRYAQSNGIALDSPGAIKAAEIARKAQSEATRNYQKASELEKAAQITQQDLPADATPQQVDSARYRNLEIQMWKLQNQDKLALEPQMVQILSDPNKRAMVQEGYLSLDDVYTMAKGMDTGSTAAAKSQGKQEALQALAHKQQAAVPTGHATNPGTLPAGKKFEDLSIAEMEAKLGTIRR